MKTANELRGGVYTDGGRQIVISDSTRRLYVPHINVLLRIIGNGTDWKSGFYQKVNELRKAVAGQVGDIILMCAMEYESAFLLPRIEWQKTLHGLHQEILTKQRAISNEIQNAQFSLNQIDEAIELFNLGNNGVPFDDSKAKWGGNMCPCPLRPMYEMTAEGCEVQLYATIWLMKTFYLLQALIAWMIFNPSHGSLVYKPPKFLKPIPQDASALRLRIRDVMTEVDSLIAQRLSNGEADAAWFVAAAALENYWTVPTVDQIAENLLAAPDWPHSTRFLSLHQLLVLKQFVIKKSETRLNKARMLLQYQLDVLRVAARMDVGDGGIGVLEMLSNAETRMAECQVVIEYVASMKNAGMDEAVIREELTSSEDLLPQYVKDVEQLTGLLGAVGDIVENLDQVESFVLPAEFSESLSCFDYLKQLIDGSSAIVTASSFWTLLALLDRDLTQTLTIVEDYDFALGDNTRLLDESVTNLRTAVSSVGPADDTATSASNELRQQLLMHQENMMRQKVTDDLLDQLETALAYVRELREE